jgi:hypothetical protein
MAALDEVRDWAHLDSNQGPTSYEPAALTAELWALTEDPGFHFPPFPNADGK